MRLGSCVSGVEVIVKLLEGWKLELGLQMGEDSPCASVPGPRGLRWRSREGRCDVVLVGWRGY